MGYATAVPLAGRVLALTDGCTVGDADAAASHADRVTIVGIGAITEADASTWITPCNLPAGAAVSEGGFTVGMAKAAQVTPFITRHHNPERPAHRYAGQQVNIPLGYDFTRHGKVSRVHRVSPVMLLPEISAW